MTIMVDPPRVLYDWERAMLEALLAEPLHGNEELRLQIPALKVSEMYPPTDPTVIFIVDDPTVQPAPVTGMGLEYRLCYDTDGEDITVILHVVDGFISELELFRGEGYNLLSLPDPSSLRPHVEWELHRLRLEQEAGPII